MAKSFVRKLMERTIGRYVELDVAALDVALWKGKVELRDVPLRKDVLDSLGLPLVLEGGVISHISMNVPWRHLSTKPVRLSVRGVRLKCGLRADWNIEDLRRIEGEIRRAEIELKEFLQQRLRGDGAEASQSYWKVLSLRVAENLQVEVLDVEIALSDLIDVTVHLESFTLRTAAGPGKDQKDPKEPKDVGKDGGKEGRLSKEIRVAGLAVSFGAPGSTTARGFVVPPLALQATIDKAAPQPPRLAAPDDAPALAPALAPIALLGDQGVGPLVLPPSSLPISERPARWTVAVTAADVGVTLDRVQWAGALNLGLRFGAAADHRVSCPKHPGPPTGCQSLANPS